ncbi:MAG: phosphoglycerate dehydrogenase [Anaerolineales bacterium]
MSQSAEPKGRPRLQVLVSAPYFIPAAPRFALLLEQAGLDLVIAQALERLSEDELLRFAGQVDGAICGDDRFSRRVLEAFAPRLRVISKWGTGVDSIDRPAADDLGVQVRNTPGAFTQAVADSVMGYVLAFARQLPWLDGTMKSGTWQKRPARTLAECSLGVIGVGRIGKAVLRRARAFSMRLWGNDMVEVNEDFQVESGVRMTDLDELLAESDFVSLHCDLNASSRHLIDRPRLARMKSGAVLINTARGAVVQEEALIEALQSGALAGAALDVFEEEPLPSSSPLRTMAQVMLAPHNANASRTAWEAVHRSTLRHLFEGLELPVPIDLQATPGESTPAGAEVEIET